MNLQHEGVDMSAKLKALKKLSQRSPDTSHHEELEVQAAALKNDRGFCLLVTSMLENNLDQALEHRLTGLKKAHRNDFFDSDGLAGNFSRKIALGAALGVFGPITLRNLTSSGIFVMHLLMPKFR
jgi:hypothetical protein